MRPAPEHDAGRRAFKADRSPRYTRIAIAICFLFLLIPCLRLLWFARSFPIVSDQAIIRYVTFMVAHGHAPYTWMIEMNPPGTLMTEWLSMHLFGPNAGGLWWWDVLTGLLAAAGAAWIADRGFRLAAVAGVQAAWFTHLMSGPDTLAERDWFVGALLLLAAGCAAQAMRSNNPAWMAGLMGLGGWAGTIKPYAVIVPLALLIVVLLSTRERWRLLLWSAAGGLVPLAAVAMYLHHWPGAFTALLHTERTIGAWYAQSRAPLSSLFLYSLIHPVFVMLLLAAVLWIALRSVDRSTQIFAAGAVTTTLLYVMQGKGFVYQSLPMLLFTFAGGCVAAQRALGRGALLRFTAALFLFIGFVWIPVRFWKYIPDSPKQSAPMQAIIGDLRRLGGSSLDGRVQCLDLTGANCIGALYALRLQQPTGFVGDFMLFPYEQMSFAEEMRGRFLEQFSAAPPKVIILSNHNWDGGDFGFTKPDRWNVFAQMLERDYTLEKTAMPGGPYGYRLYIRRPS